MDILLRETTQRKKNNLKLKNIIINNCRMTCIEEKYFNYRAKIVIYLHLKKLNSQNIHVVDNNKYPLKFSRK